MVSFKSESTHICIKLGQSQSKNICTCLVLQRWMNPSPLALSGFRPLGTDLMTSSIGSKWLRNCFQPLIYREVSTSNKIPKTNHMAAETATQKKLQLSIVKQQFGTSRLWLGSPAAGGDVNRHLKEHFHQFSHGSSVISSHPDFTKWDVLELSVREFARKKACCVLHGNI